ncbi:MULTISPECIES: hypothetical protein [unclassified Psychrobacillus]|uniref:hypothetical protein n=1 Tax=unclassified Psychrobacillus TaxID=2636677 RepID=UPI0021B3CFE9
MKKQENYLKNSHKKQKLTLDNGSTFPNGKNMPGNSVDEHKAFEEANIILTGDEMK